MNKAHITILFITTYIVSFISNFMASLKGKPENIAINNLVMSTILIIVILCIYRKYYKNKWIRIITFVSGFAGAMLYIADKYNYYSLYDFMITSYVIFYTPFWGLNYFF